MTWLLGFPSLLIPIVALTATIWGWSSLAGWWSLRAGLLASAAAGVFYVFTVLANVARLRHGPARTGARTFLMLPVYTAAITGVVGMVMACLVELAIGTIRVLQGLADATQWARLIVSGVTLAAIWWRLARGTSQRQR
jgi:hypothetical protein